MTQPSSTQASQIKLLVNTASEAVSVIRERYGDRARVISVKQVEAEGLKRLISKPRLEVIVEVAASAESAKPKPEAVKPKSAPAPREEQQEAEPASAPARPNAIGSLYAKKDAADTGDYFSQFEAPKRQPASVEEESHDASRRDAPLGSAANPVKRGTLEAVQRAISMLESVGFDRSLIERVRAEVNFKDIGSLPTMELYARICDWLRSRFPNTSDAPLGSRRAFIGCSGVGKTSALCKMLSSETFVGGNAPTVLKVDSELPNPSDGLEVFCEIMGATLARSSDELGAATQQSPLLVDLPGYSLQSKSSIDACRETLDTLEIDERILVINAAYEAELIAEMMSVGESIGATRVVFTHLEETRKAGKLWKFLLNGRIKPLFFCVGPNPAGEYAMETYSYLLERSFPNGRELAAATRGRRSSSAQSSIKETALKS